MVATQLKYNSIINIIAAHDNDIKADKMRVSLNILVNVVYVLG